MAQIEDESHIPGRKGPRLPPLQASFETHRPRPVVNLSDEKPYGNKFNESPYALQTNQPSTDQDFKGRNVKRRSSRFGLAGFFTRSKPSDVDERLGKMGIKEEEEESAERPMTGGTEVSCLPIAMPVTEEIDALPPVESAANPLRYKASKPTLKVKSSFKAEIPTKKSTIWDPPPLFQAYPQAVKHATLRAPLLSAEAVLRLHVSRNASANSSSESYPSDSNPSKFHKEKRLKRHTAAEVLSKGEWTHKVFIMITSGYFLQYAGDGNFDRLPEKIMPLTTESAAFASDAIPGQPYVLQVSQVSDDQGTLDKEASRSMLKKLGLRTEMRRSTSTFLLVLESPEEMSAWLAAVRKEIQVMGGKTYKPDEFQIRDPQDFLPVLQQRPSQRYLVKRDPNRFSEKKHKSSSHFDRTKDPVEEAATGNPGVPIPAISKRQSLATQSSMVSRSVSNTTSSINQIYLDRLRESPRESYASTDAKTASTSPYASPRLSPDKTESEIPDLTCTFDDTPPAPFSYPSAVHIPMQNQAKEKGSYRESSRPSPATSPPQQPSRNASKHRRTSSPTAPNFSVPTFSKRYSTAKVSPVLSYTISNSQTPPIPLHESDSDHNNDEEASSTTKKDVAITELEHLRRESPSVSRKVLGIDQNALLTPPHSSASCDPPTFSDGENRFSRRFSSLEYSRGVSPIQPARQSPSPHPPPTAALPAIPRANPSNLTSLYPPPTTALPPIPTAGRLPQRYSMASPPRTTLPALPVVDRPPSSAATLAPTKALRARPENSKPHHISFATSAAVVSKDASQSIASNRPILTHRPSQESSKPDIIEAQQLRRPTSMQVRNRAVPDQQHLASSRPGFKNAFEPEGLTPLVNESPPKPTREPPPPPPQQGHVQGRRSVPRIGREPPPVYSPASSPKRRISVSSRAESYFDGPAPHPFIPPIRVSERKFRGSLDGPWNISYDAPQRTFLDLCAS